MRKTPRNAAAEKPPLPCPAEEVAARLLGWYGACGRDLPWRQTRDPYRIWLSEIMLQQTGVEAVIPYYRRFLEAYPTVQDLAAAPLNEVIERWAGLGYYRRARNLHAAAEMVVTRFGGGFPADTNELQTLPGVGRSTAGAICALAFDQPVPILDGNVRRVLCRLFALRGNPRATAAEKQLWAWSAVLVSPERPHDYTQAIMDLGAIVCTPRLPRCTDCPLSPCCEGFQQGLAEQLPETQKRKPVPERRQVALLIWRAGKILVGRRGLDGMLGGLWEFPSRAVGAAETADAAAAALAADLGATGTRLLGGVRHVYSHFRLDLALYGARAGRDVGVAESDDSRWLTPRELARLALHGAHRKALALIPDDEDLQ